jgi:hypothetical protein
MRTIKNVFLAALVLGSAACQDLDIMNENEPDTNRALGEPGAVENVIRTAFLIWYNNFDNGDVYNYYPIAADEMTATFTNNNVMSAFEPRAVIKNLPLNTAEQWIQRGLWDAWNSAVANTNDGLRIIRGGMKIMTVNPDQTTPTDNTERAAVWAKFVQGLALGYVALGIDRAASATEDTIIPTVYAEQIAWERNTMRPYTDVMAVAINSMDQAIARLDAAPDFTVPPIWVSGSASGGNSLTKAQLRQVINTFAARLLVYNARTPQERAAVNWQKVLTYTQNGLTFDFGPTLVTGTLESTYHDRIQANSRMRADYRLIGPADVSGAYQAWAAKPITQRDRFDIVTPDRRITGPNPNSAGAYFRYRCTTLQGTTGCATHDNNGFDVNRGLGYFSTYQWRRYGGQFRDGRQNVVLSADENRLLRAEAMFRTGDLQGAADLINVSRTRNVLIGTTSYPGLPAVTVSGVPASTETAPCVPRTVQGACGSLMDALRYERQIELAGTDPVRAWMDYRGFGQLLDGTPVHMPIAARYLVTLQIPFYTFGGVGGEGGAVCTAGC